MGVQGGGWSGIFCSEGSGEGCQWDGTVWGGTENVMDHLRCVGSACSGRGSGVPRCWEVRGEHLLFVDGAARG